MKGFSAVNASFDAATSAMRPWLGRFGPVSECLLNDLRGAFEFLFPVKSFTTRYLLMEIAPWTLVIDDMREQNCEVDAFAISRATGCNGISIKFREDDRALHLFEEGKWIRWIESSEDEDRWHFLENGALQPFEDVEEIQRKRKKDRLSSAAVQRYFERYTAMPIPDWTRVKPSRIMGIERCVRDVANPIIRFCTEIDI